MLRKTVSGTMLTLLLISMLTFQVEASTPPATEWTKTHGGSNNDSAYHVVQTSDGGYAIAGDTESYGGGNDDFWLVKTNFYGNEQWSKTYGGTNDFEMARSVVQTSDGGFLLAGYIRQYSPPFNEEFLVVKTDSSGNEQWSKTYGGSGNDRAFNAIQTSDGGYAIVGYTYSYGSGQTDFWLVKINSAGTKQWDRTYGGANYEKAVCIIQTSDGGYAIAGCTNSYGSGSYDFWLVKTDSSGNKQWDKTYGGSDYEWAYSLHQTSDGGYAIAGDTDSYGSGMTDFWLVKTNSAGNMQWSQTYGGSATSSDTVWALDYTTDGGYIIVGDTDRSGNWDFWVVKTTSTGSIQWSQTYGGTGDDHAASVQQTADLGYIIAGITESYGAGQEDFWLIKLEGGNLDGEISSWDVLTPELEAGDQLRVQVTVDNIGEIRAEYNVYIGNIWDSEGHSAGNGYSESHQIIQLDSGASQTLTLVWTTPPTMDLGDYTGDLWLQMARPGGGWEESRQYSHAISFTVVIPTEIPVAVLSASPSDVEVGETVTFDGSDSYDPDGGTIVSYFYDFGDGFDSGWTSQSTYPWEYTGPGDYYAKLKVEDDEGQISSWSSTVHIHVIPIQPQRTIFLKSETTDGLENVNNNLGTTIIFDSDPYSVPDIASKADGTYTAQANPPGSYSFHHWECSGGVSVDPASKYSNPTYATVSESGELVAVFFLDIRLCFSQNENYFPIKGLDFDHDGAINQNAHIVDTNPELYQLEDIDQDNGAINGYRLDAPTYVYSNDYGLYRIIEYWLYYAKDDKTTFGFYNGHEHDLESVYVWINSSYIIEKVSVNQHLWRNNYDMSLSIFGSPLKTLWVAVEKSGHGMILVTPLSHTLLKPDNSFTVPDTPVFPFIWLFDPNAITLLYPWRIYDGTNPTDDGFGNDALLRTGINYDLVGCPTNWFKVGNEIVSMFGVYNFHDIGAAASAVWQNTVLLDFLADMSESTNHPILLTSDQPWVFPLKVGSGFEAYLVAPWHRRDFWNLEEPFERKGFSYLISKWAMKGVAIIIALLAPIPINRILPTPISLVADFLFDPVNVTLTDSMGNVVGLKNGIWVNEIPGVLTLWHGMEWDIVLTLEGNELLECKVHTLEETTYALSFDAIYSDNSTASFNATDIPLQSNSVHAYQMNWDLLRAGQNGTTISVDQDGDGIFDQVWHAGAILVADQLLRAQNLDTGHGYATIQAAIDAPETLGGHVILVNEGTYYEHLIIDKSISLIGSDGTTIIDGNLTGSCFSVLASNAHIEGFHIVNGGSQFPNAGIRIYGDNVSIVHNSIAHCRFYGIYAYNVGGIIIQGNNITNSASAGIYLLYTTGGNTIIENNIKSSNRGIVFDNSGNNSVVGNTIANNSDVGIWGGANNTLYHNSFLNNSNHVKYLGINNIWDDGYPNGGNYWSDHTQIDNYRGPNQNETGSDGICDIAYGIDANNQDNYPLTKPYGGLYDIGITNITTSKTVVGQGYNLSVYIKVLNYGVNTETFNITVYANTTIIYQTQIALISRNSTIVTFAWNTIGFAKGNYTIWAYATPVPGETHTADNTLIDGTVLVTFPGDVNGDGKVRVDDVLAIALHFGTDQGGPPNSNGYIYDANCDINDDLKIRVDDVLTAALNFGQG